jgi:hypothetical protein
MPYELAAYVVSITARLSYPTRGSEKLANSIALNYHYFEIMELSSLLDLRTEGIKKAL